MTKSKPPTDYHYDSARFQEALTYTASTTGFRSLLIEKDYYCSLVLQDLEDHFHLGLVFKGGTCLSKVHLDFYRLSEDLDFVISIPATAPPSKRSAAHARNHAFSCARTSASELLKHGRVPPSQGLILFAVCLFRPTL